MKPRIDRESKYSLVVFTDGHKYWESLPDVDWEGNYHRDWLPDEFVTRKWLFRLALGTLYLNDWSNVAWALVDEKGEFVLGLTASHEPMNETDYQHYYTGDYD